MADRPVSPVPATELPPAAGTGPTRETQLYADDVRYCDFTRLGTPHAPHDYRYNLPDGGWGAYWCHGQAGRTRPWPHRPAEVFELDVPMVVRLRHHVRPLTHNDRYHLRSKAELVRTIRQGVHWAAKNARLPKGVAHASIQLHYRPGSRSVTDAPNLTATSKPAIDGLRDYGLVPDDTDQYVTEHMPVIHPGPGPRRCWLTVEVQRG